MRKFLYALFVVIFISCSKEEEEGFSRSNLGVVEQTTIMYFGGTSLMSFYNLNELDVRSAVSAGALGSKGRLLVFKPSYYSATLYELYEEDGSYKSETIATYTSKESLTHDRMVEVLTTAQESAPANTYNIIMSGHGTGWVSQSHPYLRSVGSDINWDNMGSGDVVTRFIGSSTDGYMEISELRTALEATNTKYGYILFDMCFMSNIETLYELKDVCDNIISSPAEVMGSGFPYDLILEDLFSEDGASVDFSSACYKYYDSYRTTTDGYPSATVAMCKTAYLDMLATSMRKINESVSKSVDIDDLQCYENLTNNVFCDLRHYAYELCSGSLLYDEFEENLNRAFPVDCRYSTERFFTALDNSGWVDVNYYSGVSTSAPSEKYRDEWAETSWVGDTE